PRTWGWTANFPHWMHGLTPSPTHVGMDRSSTRHQLPTVPEPHARGDGPGGPVSCRPVTGRAPRTWGWTGAPDRAPLQPRPSPTHVGMDRPNAAKRPAITPEPHARGDGPPSTTGKAATPPRAPRTWGWTAPARGATCRAPPSPTHVGMDRSAIYRVPSTISKPHARGDGPPTGPSPTP